MKTIGNRHFYQSKKSVFLCALFACLAGAILALGGCGDKAPANPGTPAPADRGHAIFYFQQGGDISISLEIQVGDGDILGWVPPADRGGAPEAEAGALLEANPPVTMRLPFVMENETISLFFEEAVAITDCTLEAYALGDQGTLMFSSRGDHTVPVQIDGRWASFVAKPSMDWVLSSANDSETVYRPQGYVLRCRVNGYEKVYVFRLGVLTLRPDPAGELEEMKPREAGDFWDLDAFVLVEAKSKDRPMGGGHYRMTDAEQQELMTLLKPETWTVLEDSEPRGLHGSCNVWTLAGNVLTIEGADANFPVTILIRNWASESVYLYTAPQEIVDAFMAFSYRMGDKVFPERLGAQ